jgi:hypothetical protein
MRIMEIAVVIVIATLSLSWVGPRGCALLRSVARFSF